MKQKRVCKKVRLFLILILILALGLRIRVFTIQMNVMSLSYDPKNYWIMSHQLVDKGVYGYHYDKPSETPNAYVMPGYPLFLASVYMILGDKYLQITAVRLIQVIVSVLSVLLGFMFVKKAFKDDLTALLTAFFMAIYPTYAMSPVMLLTETLALFTMLLYFWLSLYAFETGKKSLNFITGIAFGLHLMIRPALMPLFILPFIFYLVSCKRGENATYPEHSHCVILSEAKDLEAKDLEANHHQDGHSKPLGLRLLTMFTYQLAGLVIVLAPWWIRNTITLGRFILTAEGSGNPFLAGTYPYFQDYMQDLAGKIDGTNESQLAYGIERIINGFKNDFWLYLKWFTIGKTGHIFHEPYLCRLLINSEVPSKMIHFATLIPGAIGIIVHSFKGMRPFWFYIYGFAILGLQLLFVPDPRFAYLLIFFVITGAAYLVSWITKLCRSVNRTLEKQYIPDTCQDVIQRGSKDL